MTPEEIENRFKYHAPDSDRVVLHTKIRTDCWALATELNELLPDGREKSIAITKLEEVMFWANASIARQGMKD